MGRDGTSRKAGRAAIDARLTSGNSSAVAEEDPGGALARAVVVVGARSDVCRGRDVGTFLPRVNNLGAPTEDVRHAGHEPGDGDEEDGHQGGPAHPIPAARSAAERPSKAAPPTTAPRPRRSLSPPPAGRSGSGCTGSSGKGPPTRRSAGRGSTGDRRPPLPANTFHRAGKSAQERPSLARTQATRRPGAGHRHYPRHRRAERQSPAWGTASNRIGRVHEPVADAWLGDKVRAARIIVQLLSQQVGVDA